MTHAEQVLGYQCIHDVSSDRIENEFDSAKFRELFRLKEVDGDGTCFYAAFAQGLYRGSPGPGAATDVRLAAGKRLCKGSRLKNQKQVEQIWQGDEQRYCEGLTTQRGLTLADDLIIAAAGAVYNVNVAIFRIKGNNIRLQFRQVPGSSRCVYLLHTQSSTDPTGGSDHYDALLPTSAVDVPDVPAPPLPSRWLLARRASPAGRALALLGLGGKTRPHEELIGIGSRNPAQKRRRVLGEEAYAAAVGAAGAVGARPRRRAAAEAGNHYRVPLAKLCLLHERSVANGWRTETAVIVEGSAYENLRRRSLVVK